jgi:BlaI family transcriptional regulator, penicillinase repressor
MNRRPTELELKVLGHLWDLGGAGTVREVLAAWAGKPTPAYTTVLKVLQIMEGKGYVAHARDGRSYRYAALLERQEHSRGRLRDVLEKIFRGNRLELVSSLVEEMDLTRDEIREVKKMLDRKAKGGAA